MQTPAEVIAQLDRGPSVIRALIDAVPPSDLRRRPAPVRWSAQEHAAHVGLMEPIWAQRLERILTETNPHIVSYEPDTDEAPDRLLQIELTNAIETFEQDRSRLVARLNVLTPADWARPAVHTAHARYSAFLMCRHLALHDLLHAYRIEECVLGTHWPTERLAETPGDVGHLEKTNPPRGAYAR